MYVAEVPAGFKGREEKICQTWVEETGDDRTRFKFEGNVVRIYPSSEGRPTAWDEESLRNTFQRQVHRVLPGCEIVWEGSKV